MKQELLEYKKSKFISLIIKIESKEQIDNIINNIKKEYKKYSHLCYCYIINNETKIYEDKEPKGTSGYQIYNCLISKNITNVLAVVVRYKNGANLGIGPLGKCYYKVTNDNITNNDIQ